MERNIIEEEKIIEEEPVESNEQEDKFSSVSNVSNTPTNFDVESSESSIDEGSCNRSILTQSTATMDQT